MEIAYELARKALLNPKRRSGEIRLAKALIALSDAAHAVVALEYPKKDSEVGHPHPSGYSVWATLKRHLEGR